MKTNSLTDSERAAILQIAYEIVSREMKVIDRECLKDTYVNLLNLVIAPQITYV